MNRFLFIISSILTLDSLCLADTKNPDYDATLEEAWRISSRKKFSDVSDRLIDLTKTSSCKEKLKNGTRKIYLFNYQSDGLRVKGYISFVPDQKSFAPVLFFLRGGNRWFGLMNPANRYSCYGPYTVIGLSYRGSVSEGVDEFGGDDVADVKNLINYFPTIAERLDIATTTNHYLVGTSRGGLQMFLALNRYQNIHSQFKAVMSFTGVLDLSSWIIERPDMLTLFRDYFFMTDENAQVWIRRRNPLVNIKNISRDLPIIIVQAARDELVDVKEGKSMVKALLDEGFRSIQYREISGAGHGLKNIRDDVKTIWQLFGEEK